MTTRELYERNKQRMADIKLEHPELTPEYHELEQSNLKLLAENCDLQQLGLPPQSLNDALRENDGG